MGDGESDAGHVYFIVFWLRHSSFGLMLIMFDICFADVLIFVYVCVYGCKYRHELSYKSPISGIIIILSCCHDILLLSKFFIINTAIH